jgi:thiamine biosynthesis lipoprotein ApbE
MSRPDQESYVEEDHLNHLDGSFHRSVMTSMTFNEELDSSDYSKLNRHHFRQTVVPPSSARFTVIERMEN